LTFLKEAADSTFNALENQDFPFDDLVNLFHFNRDPKRNPLFDILYDFVEKKESSGNQKYPSAFAEKQNPFKSRDLFSLFDISFVCIKWHDILVLRVDYNSSLFKEETISRLILFFERIIESIIRNPKLKISQIEILQKEEQETLMKTMRDNLRLEFQDNIFMENNANAMNPEFEL
jgi:non-ribosomal peptide synthetase component F